MNINEVSTDSIAFRCKRRRCSIYKRIHDPNQIMPMVVTYLGMLDLCMLQGVNKQSKLLTDSIKEFTTFERPQGFFDIAPESSILRLLSHLDDSWAMGVANGSWEITDNSHTTVSVIRRDMGGVCTKMIEEWSQGQLDVQTWSDALEQALMWGATSCANLLSDRIPIVTATGQQKYDIMRGAVAAAMVGGTMAGVMLVEKYLKMLADEGHPYIPQSHVWSELIKAPIDIVRTMLGFIKTYSTGEPISIEVGLLFSGFVNRPVPQCLELMRVFGAPPEIHQWGTQKSQIQKDYSLMALANMIEVK